MLPTANVSDQSAESENTSESQGSAPGAVPAPPAPPAAPSAPPAPPAQAGTSPDTAAPQAPGAPPAVPSPPATAQAAVPAAPQNEAQAAPVAPPAPAASAAPAPSIPPTPPTPVAEVEVAAQPPQAPAAPAQAAPPPAPPAPAAPAYAQPVAPAAPAAPTQQAQVPVQHVPNAGIQAVPNPNDPSAMLASMGFEGVDLSGYGAFPVIRLHEGEYNSSDGALVLGPQFDCIFLESKKKLFYKNGLPPGDPNEEFFYTYDDQFDTRERPVQQILQEWAARGWTAPQRKPYVDQMCRIVGGAHDGKIIILSIPKTSIQRWSSHLVNMVAAGKNPKADTTRVSKGPRVTNVTYPFTPMQFDIA